jgi:uncharacterized protein YrrD
MEKSYSLIVGMPVVIEGMGKVGRVTDVIIDHKDGRVAAFFVNNGKMKIITPMDIIFFGQAITIGDHEDIIDAREVIKVDDIIKGDIRILKNRVETQKGDYLGNVQDYYVDVKSFGLTKILVYKSFFGLFRGMERLIPARDIVEIKKGLIVVKNKWGKSYIEDEDRVAKLYPDVA